MTPIEELELHFTSRNEVPVDRAWVKKELFDRLLADYKTLVHQRNMMMQAVVDAAYESGFINADVPLDGPQALMVLKEMAETLSVINKIANAEGFKNE